MRSKSSRAFLHLQRWKGDYKRLTYGEQAMPRLAGRSLFKLSRFGVAPLDAPYDDARGANMSALIQAHVDKDITEMNDDEFEQQLRTLQRVT